MIKVIARKGLRVPVEDAPTRYVTDEEPVEVPRTAYWMRRLKDGDLLLHTETKAADKNAAKSVASATKAEK